MTGHGDEWEDDENAILEAGAPYLFSLVGVIGHLVHNPFVTYLDRVH